MKRTPEVLDCWYDSGSMPFAQLHYPFENKEMFEKYFPAEFISEGMDQTRGWFYSLLAVNTLLFGKSPFKRCLPLGLVNDKHGKNLEYRAKGGGFTPDGEQIMKNKIRTIYRIALANGHDSLVAGAFGCGAFRLPADKIAHLFHEIINETEFKNKFTKVIFAILDQEGKDGKFAPFYELFN
jgi:isoleucyl-tRNA synthetase